MNTWESPDSINSLNKSNQYHDREFNSTADIMNYDMVSIRLYHDLLDRLIDFGIRFDTKNSKNTIVFSKTLNFAFIKPFKHGLEICLLLDREADELPFNRIQPSIDNRILHTLIITEESQVNITLVKLMKEAFQLVV